MVTKWHADPASYRDASSRIYHHDGQVYRTLHGEACADYEMLRDSGLLERFIRDGDLVETHEIEQGALDLPLQPDTTLILRHRRLPFVSYPYEWSFRALKAAALFHIDIHLIALSNGMTLSDASAYNVQFIGARPLFIDIPSFKRYQEGAYWLGYRQFCEQFLNPLLLRALCRIPHNDLYRGRLEGISSADLRRMLPLRATFSPRVLTHVVLQAALGASHEDTTATMKEQMRRRPFPKSAHIRLLETFRKWIEGLKPDEKDRSFWADYGAFRTYTSGETLSKLTFVRDFADAVRPSLLWDIGCNTGEFAEAAIDGGASYVIGWDVDQDSLDSAFEASRIAARPFTPLYGDAANPAPAQGWGQEERGGWRQRGPADALLGLALMHHLAIGRNIPIRKIVDWLVGLAPTGIIEFVPKTDPQVERMLTLREDIFDDYCLDTVLDGLEANARIVRRETLHPSGRELIWYDNGRSDR